MTTPRPNPPRNSPRQHGAAMLIMMLIMILGLIALFAFRMDRKGPELNADRKTAQALAQAKEALLGYAAADSNHPGSLPCPDANDDGLSNTKDYTGSACTAPVGRLPWKSLGLADIRDGSGERLWYAVSPSFDANTSKINSTMGGELTVRASSGAIVYDSSSGNGVIAVVIAPGAVLTRDGSAAPQDRTCSVGVNCDISLICTNKPYTDAPKCSPKNYLDVLLGVEDNANFIKNSSTNGFIAGPVRDASDPSRFVVNDRVLVITRNDLFSVVKKRIFAEIRGSAGPTTNCLSLPSKTGLVGFAATPPLNAFPWAATFVGGPANPGTHTGYPPAADLNFAKRGGYCQWTVMQDNGWDGLITYEVSQAYAPGGSGSCGSTATSCLVVNGTPNAKVRVTIDGTDFGIW